MEINASLVKELREKTGLGIMECKDALKATSGNLDAAIDLLRKNSNLKAVKKSGRTAAEGVIAITSATNRKSLIMVEINCETDFVAKDENFLKFSADIAQKCLTERHPSFEKMSEAIENERAALVQKVGENVQLRNYHFIDSEGFIYSYVHGNRKIGTVIELEKEDEELGNDLAMHIAATNPLALSKENISLEILEKEKEIFMAQSENSGKPKEMLEKIVGGKLEKFLAENALLEQNFVKNPDVKIRDLVKNKGNKILKFVRLEVGTGIEKEVVDFASEVMSQLNK